MTTNVHFAYHCEHILQLQDDLVPGWLLHEFFGGIDFDPNTWNGITHDYGTILVEDLCSICKEEARRARRKAAKKRRPNASRDSTGSASSTPSERSKRGTPVEGEKESSC